MIYIVTTKDGLEIARGGENKRTQLESYVRQWGKSKGYKLIKKRTYAVKK